MILNEKERKLLFIFGCMPARLIISLLPFILLNYDMKIMTNVLVLLLFTIGLSFFILYFNSWRLNAPEGGGDTWWKKFRWLHGIIYILASCMLFYLNNYSCKERVIMKCNKAIYLPSGLLLFDTIIGLILFLHRHIYM